MKNLFMALGLATSVLVSSVALAAPKDVLSERLNLNTGFSANFSQTVVDADGTVVMQGQGKAQILRPNQFRWETTTPNETLLVSDGKSVWYYDPFVEQVSILDQAEATAQTPFVLLTRNQASDWEKYTIVQRDDLFVLAPKDRSTNVNQFQIEIDAKGVVKRFYVIEQDGQQSRFGFQNFKSAKPSASQFSFVVPMGVTVDDQRQ